MSVKQKIKENLTRYLEINAKNFDEEYIPAIFIHPKAFFELREETISTGELYEVNFGKYIFMGYKLFIDRDINIEQKFIITCKKSYAELEYRRLENKINEMFK